MPTWSIPCRGDRRFDASPEETAVLAIDLQREFFADGAGPEVEQMRLILPRVSRLLDLARQLGCFVVHTRETYAPDLSDVHAYRRSLGYVGRPGPLGKFCIRGEPGNAFVEAAQPLAEEPVIDKAGFSAFYQSELNAVLQRNNVRSLLICGVTTQCCVHSTLREAVDRGYWCLTVSDCCAASEPGLHDKALDLIAGEGHLFGWVTDLQSVEQAAHAFQTASGLRREGT